MDIIVSHLPYLGCFIVEMEKLPKEYGIEVFIEYGTDYFWEHILKRIMDGRTGPLSIHGPFVQVNLADPECDYEAVRESYKWSFEYTNRYNATHCVCHPHAAMPALSQSFTLQDCRNLAIERMTDLNDIAKGMGVEMLIENMPYKPQLVFDQDSFTRELGGIPDFKFLIDIGHAMLHNWDLSKLLKDLNHKIKAYHVHENMGDADTHLKIGEGILDWQKFFGDYKKYTPNANLVLEYMTGPIDLIVNTVSLIDGYLK